MQIAELLDELSRYHRPLPHHLVADCIARRDEITPVPPGDSQEFGGTHLILPNGVKFKCKPFRKDGM